MTNEITAGVMIKLEENIKAEDIIALEEKLLDDKNNIEALAEKCFEKIDKDFVKRAKFNEGGFIVGKDDYCKGTSSELSAVLLSHLGIKGVIAKSFDEKHKKELIENNILPMVFANPEEYNAVGLYDILKIKNIAEDSPKGILEVVNITKGDSFLVEL